MSRRQDNMEAEWNSKKEESAHDVPPRVSPSFVGSRKHGSDPSRGSVAGHFDHQNATCPHSPEVSQPSPNVRSNSPNPEALGFMLRSPLQAQSYAESVQTGACERLPDQMAHTTIRELPTSASSSQTPVPPSPVRRDIDSTSLSLEPTMTLVPTLSPVPSQTQTFSNNTLPAQAGDSSSSILQKAASSHSLTAEVTLSPAMTIQPPQEGLPEQRPTDSNLTNIGSTMTVPQQSNNSDSTPSESSMPDPQTTEATAASSGQTCKELGIIAFRPKYPHFASLDSRKHTFINWWPEVHNFRVDDLARAGFYFTGYGDCARCFHCGIGLKNWGEGHDSWVEHARWSSKCAFLLRARGPEFVSTVTSLKKDQEQITMAMVEERTRQQNQTDNVRNDPAVKALLSVGLDEARVLQAVSSLAVTETSLSAENLLNVLRGSAGPPDNCPEKERLQEQRASVRELRREQTCKVCGDRPRNFVFLPCGHLASCGHCCFDLITCPVCCKDIEAGMFVRFS